MAEKTLIAKIRPDDDSSTLIVASPVVGLVDGAPKKGNYLNPLDQVLTVKILNERWSLRLPREVQGRVVEVLVGAGLTPVAFNDGLLRIDPRAMESGPGVVLGAAGAPGSPDDTMAAQVITVSAPTEGIFYSRPSPDAPPYVELGTKIATGAVLGLVEVMKCFNQITFGGPGLPPKGEITRILVEDSKEVQFGQPLFWIMPVD